MRITTRTHSTVRKVVASLGVLGTAAAVAGLGTYGSFTDSTTPVSTDIGTAVLDLALDQPAGAAAIPVSTSNFLPGDSLTRALDLSNAGGARLSSVTVGVTAAPSNLLTTDTSQGLQLAVRWCSVAWVQATTPSGPTYSCPGTEQTLLSGPVVGSWTLAAPTSLTPGGRDRLVFTISLPSSADNRFQGLSSTATLTFTGLQATGGRR